MAKGKIINLPDKHSVSLLITNRPRQWWIE